MSYLDYVDIFRTPITFSNRLSSTPGKVCTLIYFGMFVYLSLSGILTVFNRETKKVIETNSYNPNFQTDSDFFKNLNINIYLQLYRTDNKKLEKSPEEILKEFLKFQISYINSKCLKYTLINMYEKLVYSKDNLIIFFADYQINTLSDFFKFSIDKQPLKSEKDLDLFFKTYTIRINVEYFFLKEKKKMIMNTSEIDAEILKQGENKVFSEYGYADYILNTKGVKSTQINSQNYNKATNNFNLIFRVLNLILDPNVILTSKSYFKGFILDHTDFDINSKSIFSIQFKLSAVINTLSFGFKKIAETFAEISGIMELIKFIMIFYVLIINFANTQHYFTMNFFDRKIFIKSFEKFEDGKSTKRSRLNNSVNASKMSLINPIRNIKNDFNNNPNNNPINLNSNYNNNNFNNVFRKNENKIKQLIIDNEHELSDIRRIEVAANSKITKRSVFVSNDNMPNLNRNLINCNDNNFEFINFKNNNINNNCNLNNDNRIEDPKFHQIQNSLENEKGFENNGVAVNNRLPILNKISGFNQNVNLNINNKFNTNNNNNNNNNNNLNNEIKTYSDNERFKKSSVREINNKSTTKSTEKDLNFKVFLINENLEIEEPKRKKTFNSYNNNNQGDEVTQKYFEAKRSKRSFSVCKLFLQLLCPFCFKNSKLIQLKKKVFYNFMKRNFEKTDMMFIQNRMRYLDILIHLVLDDRHIALLDNVSKERFFFDCDRDTPSFLNKLSIRFDPQSKYLAYKQLRKKAEENELNEIDRKMIEILDEELSFPLAVGNKE